MLWTSIPHGQVSNTDIDEVCTVAWLAVWLMLLTIFCCRVHNFCVILNFVVLYSPLVQVRFVAIGKLQDVSNSWLAILLHFHRLCLCYGHWAFFFFLFFPQAYIRRGWEGFWWDFGQGERNEPWWPNPWCLIDPQWASENQQYGGRGEQMNKRGVRAFGCQCIDYR